RLGRTWQYVDSPRRGIFGGARPPPREQRVVPGLEFRLYEKIAEGGMCDVARLWREHNFSVARQFNLAGATRKVRHGHPAQLGVVFSRHDHFHVRDDAGIASPKV